MPPDAIAIEFSPSIYFFRYYSFRHYHFSSAPYLTPHCLPASYFSLFECLYPYSPPPLAAQNIFTYIIKRQKDYECASSPLFMPRHYCRAAKRCGSKVRRYGCLRVILCHAQHIRLLQAHAHVRDHSMALFCATVDGIHYRAFRRPRSSHTFSGAYGVTQHARRRRRRARGKQLVTSLAARLSAMFSADMLLEQMSARARAPRRSFSAAAYRQAQIFTIRR